MPSRRDVLRGAAAAGAAALVRPISTLLASASQPSTPVNWDVPPGACDCHTHVFDPTDYPYAPSRGYTPEPASVEEMRALHRALHTERVVIVQPSIYGTDNACTLNGVKQQGSIARAVAVIDEKTPDSALHDMKRAGARGIRLNFANAGQRDPELARRVFEASVPRVVPLQWHIQMYTQLSVIEAIADQVMASPVPVVFDHFGGAQAALGVDQPGFGTLLKLVKSGKAYVKISAPYRSSTKAPDYPDVAPLAKALIAANLQRIVWGSDWPHPGPAPGGNATAIAPLYQIDDGRVLNQLPVWAPDAAQRKTILVENPARLYGF
jgi:predicted TIM-barrel fold metal-dependent hydrolase